MSRSTITAWVAALLLTAAGVIVLVVAAATPASFGWFAYQPLANEFTLGSDRILITRQTLVGVLLTVIGLIGLSFLLGRSLPCKTPRDVTVHPRRPPL
ncbi:hypothetical protein [Microbacterium sp. cf332]|uniref:hypothetical protein n=1 Tax=Microbacterium sp. cf332 TaxID=1761804 RepID=UPI00088088E6|nr:hypothetical protein [Microbacterium sp. cf332]SDQ54367.1 hypothetical protein SAMN04487847_1785 [Microbacterium sp. cf332]